MKKVIARLINGDIIEIKGMNYSINFNDVNKTWELSGMDEAFIIPQERMGFISIKSATDEECNKPVGDYN